MIPIITAESPVANNTIYVDDDASLDWYDETHVKTIQEGIDAASDGFKIFVYSGIYYEHVKINKSIVLQGEDKENTLIDAGGSGDVIYVSDDNVEITDFSIINSGNQWLEAGIELNRMDHCTITGNIISYCGFGIATLSTSDILISGNIISDNDNPGIRIQDTKFSTITRNTIKNNYRGLYINAGYFNYIAENNFIDNERHADFYGVFFNQIKGNYWDRLVNIGPKLILGRRNLLFPLPGFILDWNPASEPYDFEKISSEVTSNNKWMKAFGGFRSDAGFSVEITSDGGYVIVGETRSFGNGRPDVWLIKLDSNGNKLWDKTYGGKEDDVGWSIQQTSDEGYIIIGETESYSDGRTDAWLIKTDSKGNKLWDKVFGYGIFDSGSEIRQTSDGGYIIVGKVNITGGPRGDIWLLKTDSGGNKLWAKEFGGVGHNYGQSIEVSDDGGYIIVGASYIPRETKSYDLWLIKTDENGEILWDRKHGGSSFEMGNSIRQTIDGGFIITGETSSYGGGSDNAWLLKTDSNGYEEWNRTFVAGDIDRGCSVQQTSDSGFIIAGHTTRLTSYEAWLIKTDNNGETEWIKTYGKPFRMDIFFSVQQTDDGGYIIVGESTSYGFDIGQIRGDVWVLKTDSVGNVPRFCRRSILRN